MLYEFRRWGDKRHIIVEKDSDPGRRECGSNLEAGELRIKQLDAKECPLGKRSCIQLDHGCCSVCDYMSPAINERKEDPDPRQIMCLHGGEGRPRNVILFQAEGCPLHPEDCFACGEFLAMGVWAVRVPPPKSHAYLTCRAAKRQSSETK